MRRRSLLWLLLLAACPGGNAAVGDHCGDSSDCQSSLQCVDSVCVPHCQRATDCGDGFACDKNGLCQRATGQEGDPCQSESDCSTGLACELAGVVPDAQGNLTPSCTAENPGHPPGSVCETDSECRDGTCALGHCTDLCRDTRDCAEGTSCTQIPRVEAKGVGTGAVEIIWMPA